MIKPPIVVYNWGPIDLPQSVDEAERSLEWPDVQRGEYLLFDSEAKLLEARVFGRAVDLVIADEKSRFLPQVRRLLRLSQQKSRRYGGNPSSAAVEDLIRMVSSSSTEPGLLAIQSGSVDLTFCATVDEAKQVLAPYSVQIGEYLVFRVDGMFMSVKLDGREVIVEPPDADSRFEPQVRYMLLAYLTNFSEWADGSLSNAPLGDIIQLVSSRYRGRLRTRR